jgi:ribosomal peptide maturation radical SAM protein 1
MVYAPKNSILLIVPPFQITARPALGVSQLKANLQEQGFSAGILYSHFSFAERIGLDLYEWIFGSTFNTLTGEFIFSDLLFHHSDEEIERYVKRVLTGTNEEDYLTHRFPHKSISQVLRWLMQEASIYCDNAIDEICAHDPWMVGFTSSFQQNCASLALIKRIKQVQPNILTAMGGANCQSEMGRELFRIFPEIDYIGQGECDHSFIKLVRSLLNGDEPSGLPGILFRNNAQHPLSAQPLQDEDLNRLPYPDFSDYFTQLGMMSFADRISPGLVMETSRGCWWGAKQPCTFCGLNGEERGFRSKSASRSMEEMVALVNQYGVRHIWMADNILDMKYFKTFLPELADHPVANIFYETKPNLSKPQIRLLAQSQIGWIQPGIESLSDRTLRLMRKGTTKIQNIQLLKWCAGYGIWVGWNYLYGFPDERKEEVAEIAQDVEALHHLQPPHKISSIRMDRFSRYFIAPGTYGLEPVYPAEPYRHIYPFPSESLKRLAYFYQSNFFENVCKSDIFRTLEGIVTVWQKAHQRSFLLAIRRKKSLIIIDTRPCAQRFWHRLVGVQRRVYEFCDKAQTVKQICSALESVRHSELESILDSFVRAKLMIYSGGRYLSLAVDSGQNCGRVMRVATGGFVKPANASVSIRQKLLRLVTLRIPPRKIVAAVARRASNLKTKTFHKTIFHLTRLLSESHPDEFSDSV